MKKHTLVLGASENIERYSNKAIRKLREKKIKTFAIGARSGKVLDVDFEIKKKVFSDIHTVTLYLNPIRQKEYYEYVIGLRPNRVVFNPGTENLEFIKLLKEHKITVEIACTLVLLSTNQY